MAEALFMQGLGLFKVNITASGPLGIELDEYLVVGTTDEQSQGHQAGIRPGMRLQAFQGERSSRLRAFLSG